MATIHALLQSLLFLLTIVRPLLSHRRRRPRHRTVCEGHRGALGAGEPRPLINRACVVFSYVIFLPIIEGGNRIKRGTMALNLPINNRRQLGSQTENEGAENC